jgi:hypothetical protein
VRTAFLFGTAIVAIATPASAEVSVPFAHKLWELRVVSLTNPGTSKAVLTARISVAGAREYCVRDPGGDTARLGGVRQCVRHLMEREGARTYTFRANCPRRMIFDGERWFRQMPLNEAGEMHWQDLKTREALDASGATNHDEHNAQLEMLCPGARTSPY